MLQTRSARMRAELLRVREAMAPWEHDAPGRDLDELLATITRPDAAEERG